MKSQVSLCTEGQNEVATGSGDLENTHSVVHGHHV